MKLSEPEQQACTAAHQALAGQQFESAELIYRDLLQTFPQSVVGRVNLANLYLQRNDYQAAHACLTPLAEPDCQVAEWWFSWSLVQAALGAWSDALHAAEQAGHYGLDPQSVMRQRCTALQHLNQADQAIALARAFAREHPSANNQAFYAAMLNESGQAMAALVEVAQVVSLAEKMGDDKAKLEALRVQAGALVNTHQLKAALDTYQTLRQAGQDDADLQYNQSLAHLLNGDWAAGFALYEVRFQSRIFGKNRRVFPGQSWAGEALGNRSLTVIGEQGLGDRIHFVRYLSVLRQAFPQARLLYMCSPALQALLQPYVHSLQIEWLADTEENLTNLATGLTIPLLSLPHVLGQYSGELALPPPAQFVIDTAARAQARLAWRSYLGPVKKIKVGLVNAGGRTLAKDHDRSIPLAVLQPLLRQSDVLWVNLQPDLREESLEWLAGNSELAFFNPLSTWAAKLDFAVTAALIEDLDLVITVDTAVAHLAASLGRPTWLLNRFNPDWRWQLETRNSVWYPSLQQFRQMTYGDWHDPIQRCAMALAEWIEKREAVPVLATEDPSISLQRALGAIERGEFDAAAQIALYVLQEKSTEPLALYVLACQAEHQQRWQDAADLLRLALDSPPQESAIWLALARVEAQRQRWSECVNSLWHVLFLQPSASDVANDLIQLQGSLPVDVVESIQRHPDNSPRFTLPVPGILRQQPEWASMIDAETNGGGVQAAARIFLEAHLQAGDGVIDVGAGWGWLSLSAATHPAGQIQVWSLESNLFPSVQLSAALRRAQLQQQVHLMSCAVGLGAPLHSNSESNESTPVHSLDDIFNNIGLPPRCFLAIQQSNVLSVLQGAQRLLNQPNLQAVLWTVGETSADDQVAEADAILELLARHGFQSAQASPEQGRFSFKLVSAGKELACDSTLISVRPALVWQSTYPSFSSKQCLPPSAKVASSIAELSNYAVQRARLIAEWLPVGARVLDFAIDDIEDALHLRACLVDYSQYYLCAPVARLSNTIVCDIQRGEFPWLAAAHASHLTLLGGLETQSDVPVFLSRLRAAERPLVLTYRQRQTVHDPNELAQRIARGWRNHYTQAELASLMCVSGWTILRQEKINAQEIAFYLLPEAPVMVQTKTVGILSYSNVGNFGDRLGTHVIHSLLPAHAVVKPLFFKPFTPLDEELDLLILGIGNSLFKPLMTPQLTVLLKRSKHAIGIFGTQYRQQIDLIAMRAIIESLDHWYARYAEDVLLYGQGLNHVTHLGDCLISQFPLTTPVLNETLRIGDEVWEERALDRTISHIQQYKKVHSTRLHPLLCALTSAEEVAYVEQRESGVYETSGKFGAMLHDVFGRRFPEGQWWSVEQTAVQRYKHQVQMNLLALQEQIHRLLA